MCLFARLFYKRSNEYCILVVPNTKNETIAFAGLIYTLSSQHFLKPTIPYWDHNYISGPDYSGLFYYMVANLESGIFIVYVGLPFADIAFSYFILLYD